MSVLAFSCAAPSGSALAYTPISLLLCQCSKRPLTLLFNRLQLTFRVRGKMLDFERQSRRHIDFDCKLSPIVKVDHEINFLGAWVRFPQTQLADTFAGGLFRSEERRVGQ